MKAVIVAGTRTPFARAGTDFRSLSAVDLGRLVVRDALDRGRVKGEEVDHLVFGTVVHDPHAGNIAREVGLTTLPKSVPATTVSRACATSNQAITDAANLIEVGQADTVIAGGAESLNELSEEASGTL